jgi:putative transposase
VSDSNVIKLAQLGAFTDSLTEILRSGARALLTQAVEAEVAEFLAKHADLKTETGRQRVVRHGHLPEREIMTGIGPVAIRQPRVRDREAAEGERIWYSPWIVPPYARRSKSLEVLIPVLYLKGISTGDFEEALAALVGKDAPGLSASTIARLKARARRCRHHEGQLVRERRQSSAGVFLSHCSAISGYATRPPGVERRTP